MDAAKRTTAACKSMMVIQMKAATCLLIVALFWSASNASLASGTADEGTWRVHATLSNTDLRAIERATKELRKLRPGWADYEISVVETDATFQVTFWQPESQRTIDFAEPQANGTLPKILGSMPIAHGGLVVELEKDTLRLVGTSNIR